MSLLLCLTLLSSLTLNLALATDSTTSGPKYEEEAKILWNQGNLSFGKGDYSQAAYQLQRFINHYPGRKGYLDAHLLLGLTRIRLQQYEQAILPLRTYIEAATSSPESFRARIALGRAYLSLRKPHEALLSSMEILESKQIFRLPNEVRLEALLVKSWALIGLNKDFRAGQTQRSFQSEFDQTRTSSQQETESYRIAIELKLRECSKTPGSLPMEESEALLKIQQRGTCLLETLPLLKKAITAGDHYWIEEAEQALQTAFFQYRKTCQHPPRPLGKRTATELTRYRQELTNLLLPKCREKQQQALDILQSWKTDFKKGRFYYVKKLREQIKVTYAQTR